MFKVYGDDSDQLCELAKSVAAFEGPTGGSGFM